MHLRSPKRRWIRWFVSSTLVIGLFLGVALTQVMGLSFEDYRKAYRSQPPSSSSQQIQARWVSIQTKASIDRAKFKRSMRRPLQKVGLCVTRLFQRAQSSKAKPTTNANKATINANKVKKSGETVLGVATIALQLNPFGRVTSIKTGKSKLPASYLKCFVWYLQGGKFHAAGGNRSSELTLSLQLKQVAVRRYRRYRRGWRRRGGKW